MRWFGGAVMVLTACGRLSFDEVSAARDATDTATTSDAAAGDAPADATMLACTTITCAGTGTSQVCNGRCITYCDETMIQSDAENRCIAWGGHLAAVHDAADDACAAGVLPLSAWLGYQQFVGSSTPDVNWIWLDSVQTPYTSWAVISGEPQDFDGTENDVEQCAVISSDGKWIDIGCASNYRLLCSR